MGRRPDTTDFIKGQVIILREEGYTERKIAAKLKISKTAVHNILSSGGENRKQNSGRHRKTTPRDDRFIRNTILKQPNCPSARVGQMAEEHGIHISPRTVRRRLFQDLGLPARRPATKPFLTKRHVRLRIEFCKTMKDKSSEWWEKVMFSDESIFQQVRNIGYNYVRRPKGERLNPKYTTKSFKHPPSVMVWGAISAKGPCGFHIFEKNEKLNAETYIKLLDCNLKINMKLSNTQIFMQDSAPSHTAHLVKNWFNNRAISLLPSWPPNSPDLNVIENCWEIMKRRVAAIQPTSHDDLVKSLTEIWRSEITAEYCGSLVHSMPRRIQGVLKNKGYPSKY